MVVDIGQGIFTPSDPLRADLIEDDRPYAGALLVTFGYNARARPTGCVRHNWRGAWSGLVQLAGEPGASASDIVKRSAAAAWS